MRRHIVGAVLVALVLSVPATGAGATEHEEPVATTLAAQPAPKTVAVTGDTYATLWTWHYCLEDMYGIVHWALQAAWCIAAEIVNNRPQVWTGGWSASRTFELVATLTTADGNVPVAGAVLSFRLSSGRVLQAVTDSKGQARAVGADWTDEDSYTATFAGTAKHLGSVDSAPMTGPVACVRLTHVVSSSGPPLPEKTHVCGEPPA